jgi:hypothetical protein
VQFSIAWFPLTSNGMRGTRRSLRFFRDQALLLRRAGKSGFNHIADGLPSATVELNQSHLPDRTKITWTRIDLDAGQERGGLVVA